MQTNNTMERQALEIKFKNSRGNLLLVTAFTVINIILLVTKSNSYFLFSAYVPYFLADFGMYFCGLYPAEYYGEDYANIQFYDTTVFVVLMIIAAVVVAFYLLSWFLSKKNKVGWMIFSLVFFVIDTTVMFLFMGVQLENILDVLFHAWVIISLVMGIIAGIKLKKLPPEEAYVPETVEEVITEEVNVSE